MDATPEYLDKVSHCLEFARSDLREAAKQATLVEGLILFELISDLAKLQQRLAQFMAARADDFAKKMGN